MSRGGCVEIRRVLVVDDQEEIRELVGVVLRDLAGWDVEVCDGPTALVALGPTFAPDVVLLDRALGEVSGEDVARALRGEPWFDRARLVFLTATAEAADRARFRALGAGTVGKPFDPLRLADEIRREVAALG